MEYQLKTRQVFLFFIAFIPLVKFFMLPSLISGIANEDMLLSTLFSIFLDLITVGVLIYACKKAKTDFYGLLTERFGKPVANAVFVLYAFYFVLKSFLPICEQKDYISLTLYVTFPNVIYFIPFFIISFYLCTKHLRVIGRAADILFSITVFGFILLFSLSIKSADLEAFLPIGARGFSAITDGAFSSFNWYGDGVYLLFFMGNFAYKKKDFLKIAGGFLISAIMIVLFMAVFYGVFKSIAFRQKFALTELSKYSNVINDIGRFDYIGIFCILTSSFISLSLPLYFSCYALQKVFRPKFKWIIPLLINGAVFLSLIIFNEYFASIESFFIGPMKYFFFAFGNFIPLFTPLLIKKERKAIYETDKG